MVHMIHFTNTTGGSNGFQPSLQLQDLSFFFSLLQIPFPAPGSPLAAVSLFDPTVFIYTVFLSHIPSQ